MGSAAAQVAQVVKELLAVASGSPVILCSGLKVSILWMRSRATGCTLGNRLANGRRGNCGRCLMYLRASSFRMKLSSSSVGVPITCTPIDRVSQNRQTRDGRVMPCAHLVIDQLRKVNYFGDEAHLVHVVSARENRLPVDELHEDASDGPDIDGGGVVGGVEQQLGRAVPARDHVLRHHVALRRRPRQPEVADLEFAVGVQQQVAGLQVTVDHVRRVDELEPAQDLVQEVLQRIATIMNHPVRKASTENVIYRCS
jgi:hypothetical protein